ncbi:MAG: biopolymer transporter ExbD [Candidatus Marinimicrobia bacterium]|nr:biopolymer transporter ExbD [Candidatus Neomarinimicrobiota bacterium]|tara:strand:+ start:14174 stop:14611 length:438 start_codon:yes stop_codon:yes gene_type:complete
MLIKRKAHITKEISTSSLPDIIFLLLVFFMVVTVMKTFDAPQIDMPYAKKIEKLENRRNTSFIWATKDGFTVLDDIQFSNITDENNAEMFKKSMAFKVRNNPRITVSLKSDAKSKMALITNIHKLLQDPEVNALRLNYSALKKSE